MEFQKDEIPSVNPVILPNDLNHQSMDPLETLNSSEEHLQCSKEKSSIHLEPLGSSKYQKYQNYYKNYFSKPEIIEKQKDYFKEYYIKNNEKVKERSKKRYDEIKKEKIWCKCGKTINKVNFKIHLLSKYHLKHCKSD